MDGVKFLSLLTLTSNILVILGSLLFLLKIKKFEVLRKIFKINLDKYALKIIFIVSLVATVGSLYFSERLGFAPCKLCWYQRIFMYPQVFLMGTSLYKKSTDVFKYILILSTIGLTIAAYHYNLQIHPNPYAPCGDIGFSVSCSKNFFTYFGYITIPWMSFSAFVINALISLFAIKNGKVKKI